MELIIASIAASGSCFAALVMSKYYYISKNKNTIVVLEPQISNRWTIESFRVNPPKRMAALHTDYSEPGHELPDIYERTAWTRIPEGAALPVIKEATKYEGHMEARRGPGR